MSLDYLGDRTFEVSVAADRVVLNHIEGSDFNGKIGWQGRRLSVFVNEVSFGWAGVLKGHVSVNAALSPTLVEIEAMGKGLQLEPRDGCLVRPLDDMQ